jgi:uncharacterized protein (DUF885 family)
MHRSSRFALVASSLLMAGWVAGPANASAAPPAASQTTAIDRSEAESKKLNAFFEEYFEAYLQQNPILATSIGDPRYNDRFVVGIAPDAIAAEQKLQRDALARIQTIDRSLLPPQDQLSYDIFKSARERDIAGFRFPNELIPMNQFYSTPNSFVQLGSGNGMQPFKTVKDYDDFLKRLDGFVAWSDQAIVNMREGIKRGYTLPRLLAERTLPQLQAQVVAKPETPCTGGRSPACRRISPPRSASG